MPSAKPTTSTQGDAIKLAQVVQKMSLQTKEIQKLEKKVKQLEYIKGRSDTNHSIELQRAQTRIEN